MTKQDDGITIDTNGNGRRKFSVGPQTHVTITIASLATGIGVLWTVFKLLAQVQAIPSQIEAVQREVTGKLGQHIQTDWTVYHEAEALAKLKEKNPALEVPDAYRIKKQSIE